MKNKIFVIACGGTGGHLSPGIALAERLTEKGYRCILLVSKKKIDARLSEKYSYLKFRSAPGAAFGLSPKVFAKFLLEFFLSVLFGMRLFLRSRPAAFISFGGFLTAGPAIASKILFIPVILHEANRIPGKAVRWMSRIATRIYLPPGVRLKGITSLAVRSTGFPVRREIAPRDRAEARREIGMPLDGKLLAVFGGSQGAKALNNWVLGNAEKFAAEGISILCVTGPGLFHEEKGATAQENQRSEPARGVVKFVPFCDDMASVLSAADLVVSRAGAGSLAEFVACRVPAILVPYPFAADNHQEANAKFFREKGAGIVIPQEKIDTLTDEVLSIIKDDEVLKKFRSNTEKMAREFDWSNMLTDVESYAIGHKRVLKAEQA